MHRIDTPADLGKLLRSARKALKTSQAGLSGLSGRSNRTINHAENGKDEMQFGKILELARELGVQLYAVTPEDRQPVVIEEKGGRQGDGE